LSTSRRSLKILHEEPPVHAATRFPKALNERVNAYLRDNGIPARMCGHVPQDGGRAGLVLGAYLLLLLGHFPPVVNVVLCVVWAMAIASVASTSCMTPTTAATPIIRA